MIENIRANIGHNVVKVNNHLLSLRLNIENIRANIRTNKPLILVV